MEESYNFFSLFNKLDSSSEGDEDFAPDIEASEQNEDVDEDWFSKSNYKDGKAPKVPKKEVYDLVLDNLKNDEKFDASSNFLLAPEKQTRNKKTYYNSPAKENFKPKETKHKETASGKSSLKKRELK